MLSHRRVTPSVKFAARFGSGGERAITMRPPRLHKKQTGKQTAISSFNFPSFILFLRVPNYLTSVLTNYLTSVFVLTEMTLMLPELSLGKLSYFGQVQNYFQIDEGSLKKAVF